MEADPANAPLRSDIRRRMALLAGVVLVVDQITKQVMLDWISSRRSACPCCPSLILYQSGTRGLVSALAGGGVAAKVILTIIALVVSAWLLWKGPSYQRLERLGAGLIVGGAIGNAIDHIRFGKVVDFIDVYVQTWHWRRLISPMPELPSGGPVDLQPAADREGETE